MEPASACTMQASSTGNAVNKPKNEPMPSIASSMIIKGKWSGKVSSTGSCAKRSKEEKAVADAEIEEYQQRQWKAYHTSNKEFAKCEKYCREQRELLRALEDLQQQEREMYELENHKDQVMTVCKVALANLAMWVRDHYFPVEYARAGWHRLQPFFQLPGRIHWGSESIEVELKPFNDRALNRDLEALCVKVAQEQLRLPDGRRLLFRVQGRGILHLDAQEKE